MEWIHVELSNENINFEGLMKRFYSSIPFGKYSAVSSFIGLVKSNEENSNLPQVKAIEYETYVELFYGEAKRIAQEVCSGYPAGKIGAICIVHRIDCVNVGEITSAIIVAAVHHEEANSVVAKLVGRLKARLPIWKKLILIDKSKILVNTNRTNHSH